MKTIKSKLQIVSVISYAIIGILFTLLKLPTLISVMNLEKSIL